jgi:hypothetical protein
MPAAMPRFDMPGFAPEAISAAAFSKAFAISV